MCCKHERVKTTSWYCTEKICEINLNDKKITFCIPMQDVCSFKCFEKFNKECNVKLIEWNLICLIFLCVLPLILLSFSKQISKIFFKLFCSFEIPTIVVICCASFNYTQKKKKFPFWVFFVETFKFLHSLSY